MAGSEGRGITYAFETETENRAGRKERVLVSFLGPAEPEMEAQIEAAAQAVEGGGRVPVIVATELPIAYLVGSDRPVELLPARSHLGVMSGPEYEAYLRRRWTILRAKWAVRREIALGESFKAFLERQTRT